MTRKNMMIKNMRSGEVVIFNEGLLYRLGDQVWFGDGQRTDFITLCGAIGNHNSTYLGLMDACFLDYEDGVIRRIHWRYEKKDGVIREIENHLTKRGV